MEEEEEKRTQRGERVERGEKRRRGGGYSAKVAPQPSARGGGKRRPT